MSAQCSNQESLKQLLHATQLCTARTKRCRLDVGATCFLGSWRLRKALLCHSDSQLRQAQGVELVRKRGHKAMVERQQHALLPQLWQRQAAL